MKIEAYMSDILLSRLDKFPEFLSSNDLVSLGLFPTNDAAYTSRLRGESPDYIKLKKKVLYPKSSLISYIQNHLKDGSIPRKS